jgi:hypothetical protein
LRQVKRRCGQGYLDRQRIIDFSENFDLGHNDVKIFRGTYHLVLEYDEVNVSFKNFEGRHGFMK